MEKAMDVGHVCQATVYNWKNDFLENGFRFSKSLVGKSIHEWILDNLIMDEQAKAWLRSKVGRRPKKGQAHFVVQDFQTCVNQTLLKDWKVQKWKGAKAAATNMAKGSNFLQVFESCALAWAYHLGLYYAGERNTTTLIGTITPTCLRIARNG